VNKKNQTMVEEAESAKLSYVMHIKLAAYQLAELPSTLCHCSPRRGGAGGALDDKTSSLIASSLRATTGLLPGEMRCLNSDGLGRTTLGRLDGEMGPPRYVETK
jgi:hypothetical protein